MIDINYEYAVSQCEGFFNGGYTTICQTNPYLWETHNLSIVGDGYIPECGTRIHIVEENLEVTPMMIDNAIVFTLQTGE